MPLKRDFYRALEDLLGPENVSRDPVITESYSFPIRSAATRKGEYLPRFEAVALPKIRRKFRRPSGSATDAKCNLRHRARAGFIPILPVPAASK
jgi:hypothetical protein